MDLRPSDPVATADVDLPGHTSPRAVESVEAFEVIVAELTEVLARVAALHAAVAAAADPYGPAERALHEGMARRDQLAAELGRAAVRVLAGGGEVRAAPPSSAPPAAVARIEVDQEVAVDPEPADRQAEVEPPAPGPAAPAPPPFGSPAPPPSPSPAHEAPPATSSSLLALASRGLVAQWTNERGKDAESASLRAILDGIGRPRRVTNEAQARAAISSLDAATALSEAWASHPQHVQHALVGLTSSLARHLQDDCGGWIPDEASDGLVASFRRLTKYSAKHRPGFVSGLSRRNDPERGSWLDDAVMWWDRAREGLDDEPGSPIHPSRALQDLEDVVLTGPDDAAQLVAAVEVAVDAGVSQSDPRLIALLTPHQSLLKGARRLKTLKTGLKEALKAEESAPPDVADPGMPADWPLFARTRGKRAVILGGDPRPLAAARIQDAFGFAEVEWESIDTRRVTSLAERVRRGTVDVVILLRRFIGHKHQEALKPACYETDVPLALVDTGYGVTQVRLALEKCLRA